MVIRPFTTRALSVVISDLHIPSVVAGPLGHPVNHSPQRKTKFQGLTPFPLAGV
jgi:hypothetical protein